MEFVINSIGGREIWKGNAASLRDAVEKANLGGAELADAYLAGANLAHANLEGANLADANLAGANLERANLAGANLADAKLVLAKGITDWLRSARDDVWSILDIVPKEVPALLSKLREGKINGSVYEGECSCLVGTLAIARGCRYDAIPGLEPDADRPAERWFSRITPGLTPLNSTDAAIAAGWIEEWLRARGVTTVPVSLESVDT